MTLTIAESELEFARRVDRLGAEGLTQDEIATQVGLSRSQIRYRLEKAHLAWSAESRVRVDVNNARLEEALASGDVEVEREAVAA